MCAHQNILRAKNTETCLEQLSNRNISLQHLFVLITSSAPAVARYSVGRPGRGSLCSILSLRRKKKKKKAVDASRKPVSNLGKPRDSAPVSILGVFPPHPLCHCFKCSLSSKPSELLSKLLCWGRERELALDLSPKIAKLAHLP